MTLFSAVLISVCEPLNHIHQDTKSARLIAVCKRSITLNKFGKRARGCCVHVFLVLINLLSARTNTVPELLKATIFCDELVVIITELPILHTREGSEFYCLI